MTLKGGGGKGPRRKGNAFELWCAKHIVKFLGGECHRTIMSGALDWMKGDLVARFNALEGWFLECKDRQSWSLPAWIQIAREQAGSHPWAIIFKRGHFSPCVALDLDDWLNQLAEEQELRKRVVELEGEVKSLTVRIGAPIEGGSADVLTTGSPSCSEHAMSPSTPPTTRKG